jgi:hypothetical protein
MTTMRSGEDDALLSGMGLPIWRNPNGNGSNRLAAMAIG